MTGIELARKLQTPPLPLYAKLLLEEHHSTEFFDEFLLEVQCKLTTVFAQSELGLEDLRRVADKFSDDRLDNWMQVVEKVLRQLGRYDSDDDSPWNGELGECRNCYRYRVNRKRGGEHTRVCPECFRRWRRVGENWQQVLTSEEWDAIRVGIIANAHMPAP